MPGAPCPSTLAFCYTCFVFCSCNGLFVYFQQFVPYNPPGHVGFFTALLTSKFLNMPKSALLKSRALGFFIYMKFSEIKQQKWKSCYLSKGHQHNRTGHLIQQSVQERATSTNKTTRCTTQEPEWCINASQGGLVHHPGIIVLLQPSESIARHFYGAALHLDTTYCRHRPAAPLASLHFQILSVGTEFVYAECHSSAVSVLLGFTQTNAMLVF